MPGKASRSYGSGCVTCCRPNCPPCPAGRGASFCPAMDLEPILIPPRIRVVTKTVWMQGRTTTPTPGGLARSPDAADGRFLSQPSGTGRLLPHAGVARARHIVKDMSSPSRLGLRQNPTRRGPSTCWDRLLGLGPGRNILPPRQKPEIDPVRKANAR